MTDPFDAVFHLLYVGGDFARFFMPGFCVLMAALALWQRPGGWSLLVLVGALLSLLPFVMYMIDGPWQQISPIHVTPTEIEQHALVLFLYWQGKVTGFAVCVLGMLGVLWQHLPSTPTKAVADQSASDQPQGRQP